MLRCSHTEQQGSLDRGMRQQTRFEELPCQDVCDPVRRGETPRDRISTSEKKQVEESLSDAGWAETEPACSDSC